MKDKMRLGVLPTTKVVKLLVPMSAELKATLARYAELHAQATGEKNDVIRMIPFRLEAFMASDRASVASKAIDTNELRGSHSVLSPRLVRAQDAPLYCGMGRTVFEREVSPYLTVIPVGRDGIAFDRLDLDAWIEQHKARSGRPRRKENLYGPIYPRRRHLDRCLRLQDR